MPTVQTCAGDIPLGGDGDVNIQDLLAVIAKGAERSMKRLVVYAGRVFSPANLRDPVAVAELFERAASSLIASLLREHSIIRLPPRGRLLITGDLHDNPIHLQKIIKLARLDASSDHHVVLHEIIHGEKLINSMDFSHRMLARVAGLTLQYPNQVHPLLANHELAQFTGKGISKGAGNSVELFNDGLEFAFGDDWHTVRDAINQFIAAMSLALITSSGVLCAHSLPAPHMMKSFDLDVIRRDLQLSDYAAPTGSAHLMVWGRQHTPAQLDHLAQHWNVELFCLGHEHVEIGIEVKPPRLVLLNSDHDRAAVVPIDLAAGPPAAEEALLSAIPLASI